MKYLAGKIIILNTLIHILHHRCFDELFLTWNESEDKLYKILQTMNRQYPDIQMAITMSNNINYLDVNIHHIDGHLKFQVAHELDTEPYSLPYVFGHHRHRYSTLARAALIRAVRCCANVSDFANELQDIQFAFQSNGFKKDFFINKFQLFLKEFDGTKLNKLLNGETYYDQSLYDYLRQVTFNCNQGEKIIKIKRLRRQTLQY
jgi:hypothetical protein